MPSVCRAIRITGIHPVVPTVEQFKATLTARWGERLRGEALAHARLQTRRHFDGLYLIEVALEPDDAEIDWGQVTQPVAGLSRSSWQSVWDEQPLEGEGNRWAFFLHDVDLNQPLRTPVGDLRLPQPTPTPKHLKDVVYQDPD